MVYASILVDDCVGRKGCFRRRCGCCISLAWDELFRWGLVSVTALFRGCCRENRGFDISEKSLEAMIEAPHLVCWERNHKLDPNFYEYHIYPATIWGLTVDTQKKALLVLLFPLNTPWGRNRSFRWLPMLIFEGVNHADSESTTREVNYLIAKLNLQVFLLVQWDIVENKFIIG